MTLITWYRTIFGPAFSPIVGGYVDQYLGWRWIFYVSAIIGGVVTVVDLLFLRETLYQPTDPLQEKTKPTTYRQKLAHLKFNPVSALYIMGWWLMLSPLVLYQPCLVFGMINVSHICLTLSFVYVYCLIIAQEYQVARASRCLVDIYANLDCIWLLLLYGDNPSYYLRVSLWLWHRFTWLIVLDWWCWQH